MVMFFILFNNHIISDRGIISISMIDPWCVLISNKTLIIPHNPVSFLIITSLIMFTTTTHQKLWLQTKPCNHHCCPNQCWCLSFAPPANWNCVIEVGDGWHCLFGIEGHVELLHNWYVGCTIEIYPREQNLMFEMGVSSTGISGKKTPSISFFPILSCNWFPRNHAMTCMNSHLPGSSQRCVHLGNPFFNPICPWDMEGGWVAPRLGKPQANVAGGKY